jgi:pimeloyl-ACP methyl ester carboxylesterase
MATFVLVHGAWGGGWIMSPLAQTLRQRGHLVFTPTLTGLGERVHLARPDTGLETHVQDILNVLQFEELRDVVLLGNSYGGIPAGIAADRVPERLSHLIYFDAFVPQDGKGLADMTPPEITEGLRGLAAAHGDGWRAPCPFSAADLGIDDPALVESVNRRLVMQPLATFTDRASLRNEPLPVPRSYVYCSDRPMGFFEAVATRARAAGWNYRDVPLTHAALFVAPEECAQVLIELATRSGSRETAHSARPAAAQR